MNKQVSIWVVGGQDVRMRIPLLKELQNQGFTVGAIGSEPEDIFIENNISYKRYNLHRWIGPFSDISSYRQLVKIFKEVKPDIVHGFDTKPAILTPLAAKRFTGITAFRTVTGMGYVYSSDSFIVKFLKPFYRFFQRLSSKYSKATIFQNPDDMNYFVTTGLTDLSSAKLVRGSGINIDENLPSLDDLRNLRDELGCKDVFVFTMIARLVKDKGVIEYLEASKIIKSINKNVKFLLVGPIVGEGNEAVSINEINDYSNYVDYLGHRNDINNILSLSDIFVLPSYYREGLPRVLLEAGLSGLPLITTDMPGCKEVVIPCVNGWLALPRNSRDLASKMQEALNLNKDQRNLMGAKSKNLVINEFSLDKISREYINIYNNTKSQNNE